MKIHVEQGINCDDIEITIKCSALDNNIEKIISLLSTPLLDIKGKNQERFINSMSVIFYTLKQLEIKHLLIMKMMYLKLI